MVKIKLFPALGGMTLFAILAVAALMHIIETVAGIAGRGCLQVAIGRMATGAVSLVMFPGQRKPGLVVVIADFAPGLFAVAAGALLCQFAHTCGLVRAVVFMATVTVGGGFTVFLFRLMTAQAGSLLMFSA